MYTKNIEIENYGPISQLDINFAFDGETPRPILLVGENGSGKSIVLSHIVNGLVEAKKQAYPGTPEIETGKVFKLRSSSYITSGSEWCYVRVAFERDLFMGEVTTQLLKQNYENKRPQFSANEAMAAWDQMGPDENSRLITNINGSNGTKVRELFTKACVLYFPHNRFEEPAWLNEENLTSQARNMDPNRFARETTRRVINYTSLHDIQDWLFGVAYDRAVFEGRSFNLPLQNLGINQSGSLPVWGGYSGNSTNVHNITLDVIRRTMRSNEVVNLRIGRRQSRTVAVID